MSVTAAAPTAAGDELPARPMRKDAARNRELLIEAAREVFATRGSNASLDEIAHHAGLGVGTAYRHFSNKHELIEAIVEQQFEQVLGFAEAAARADDPWSGIVEFFEAVMQSQAANRGLREVLIGANGGGQNVREDPLLEPMAQLLSRAQAAGQVREDAEASDLGFIILMLCTVSDVAGPTAPNIWHRYLPMVLDGLRPGGTAFGAPALAPEDLKTAIRERKREFARVVNARTCD